MSSTLLVHADGDLATVGGAVSVDEWQESSLLVGAAEPWSIRWNGKREEGGPFGGRGANAPVKGLRYAHFFFSIVDLAIFLT
jgi:hypothetical protein